MILYLISMSLPIRLYYAHQEQDLLDEKDDIIEFARLIYSIGQMGETDWRHIFRVLIHHSLNNNESDSKKERDYP